MSTLQSGTKYLNHSLLGANNDEKWYYYSELSVSGTHPNRTFSLDLYASDSSDLSVATLIGTKDIKTGALTLNESASSLQQRDKRSIQQTTKNPVTYWEGKMGSAGLPALSASEKTSLGIASGNNNQDNSDDDSNNENGGGPPPTKTPFNYDSFLAGANASLTNINIEGRQFRDTYKNLHYPEGLGSNRQDRIRFTQKYTQGRKINVTFGSDQKIFQRDPEIKIDGSVTLPIVTGIGDRNAVDWKDESLNPIQALGAGAAVSIFEGIRQNGLKATFQDAQGTLEAARDQVMNDKNVGGDMAKAINVYLAQQAVGAQGLLSRATGAILNPNLEMLFGGPKLRSFGFTFKLSPRDASEASQVRQILRFFKQGMSVKTSSSNVFLKTPNVFDIQYQTFNTDGNLIEHPSINFIKTCALTSCDVQYTPDGTYMTYEDPFRTMTSYQLTLNFGELDPIFDDDYTDLDDNNDQVLGY